MKLAKVTLTKPIRLVGMSVADFEVTDQECPDLRYDERLAMVDFGNDVMRPREQIVEMVRDNEQLVCPDCGEEFTNPQGLGGHKSKRHGKEKVG